MITSLRVCDKDSVRDIIFEDLETIASEIKELQMQEEKEKYKHTTITEEQVIEFLTRIAKGDMKDKVYRKTLVNVLVNKIFLYDDKFTITFNSGEEEVTITDNLLSDIENALNSDGVCLLNKVVHQNKKCRKGCP